jgi:hypothetical protein
MLPAASRLALMLLLFASPNIETKPLLGENDAVIAMIEHPCEEIVPQLHA